MNDWPTLDLDTISEFVKRGTAPVYVGRSPVSAIGQRCVRNEGFDRSAARPHSEAHIEGVLTPRPGDALVNSTGTGTIGRCCIFPGGGQYIVDGHVTVIRPKPQLADGRWVVERLRSPEGQRVLEAYCYSGSTNQVELSRTALAASRWTVPPLDEQRRIAAILDTIDEAIQTSERLVTKMRQLRVGLFNDALARVVIKDTTALGSLLESAVDGPFGSALKSEHYVERPGVRVIRLANIGDGQFLNGDQAYVSEAYARVLERHSVRPGDVLVASLGDESHHPGRACQYPSKEPAAITKADCFRLRPSEGTLHPAYLTLYMNGARGRSQISRMAQGVTRDRVNLSNLKKIEVDLPSWETQVRLADLVTTVDARISAELSHVSGLIDLRVGLASDLLSGRVRTVAS